MDKIFISYRREDSEGFARSLFQSLVRRFGKDHVFMDVEAIGLGMDFVEAIDSSLADCGALLVIIGKEWLNCTDAAGRRRLEIDDDFVRTEVAKAIERNVRVIPVLVKGAQRPKAEELPEELRSLARRQDLQLRHESWDSDVDHLTVSLESALGLARIDKPDPPAPVFPPAPPQPHPPAKPRRTKTLTIMGAASAILIPLGVLGYNHFMDIYDGYVESSQPIMSVPAVTPTPEPAPNLTPKPARVVSLSGLWIDDDGARVKIVQNGATAISQAIDPATGVLIKANWRLSGRNFEFNWVAVSGNQGYGRGVISADYNSIQYEFVDNVTGMRDAGRLTRSTR